MSLYDCSHTLLAFIRLFTSCSINLTLFIWQTDDLWFATLHFHSQLPNTPYHGLTGHESLCHVVRNLLLFHLRWALCSISWLSFIFNSPVLTIQPRLNTEQSFPQSSDLGSLLHLIFPPFPPTNFHSPKLLEYSSSHMSLLPLWIPRSMSFSYPTQTSLMPQMQIGHNDGGCKQVGGGSIGASLRNKNGTSDKEHATKRQKVDVSLFPWVKQESISMTPLNASLWQCSHSSNSMHRIWNLSNHQPLLLLVCLSSPSQNGWVFSQEQWAISTMSIQECTLSPTTTKKLKEYNSSKEQHRQPKSQRLWGLGPGLSGIHQCCDICCFLTERKILKTIQLCSWHWEWPPNHHQLQSGCLNPCWGHMGPPHQQIWVQGSLPLLAPLSWAEFPGHKYWAHWITTWGQVSDSMMTVSGSTKESTPIILLAVNTAHRCIGWGGKHSKMDCDKAGTWTLCQTPSLYLWMSVGCPQHSDFSDTAHWGLTTSLVPGMLSEWLKKTLDYSRQIIVWI